MAVERAIAKLKKKVDRDPANMKHRFKLISLYLENSDELSALDCIREALMTVTDRDEIHQLLDRADDILVTWKDGPGASYFQDIVSSLDPKTYRAELEYFIGKQIIEKISTQEQSMAPRDAVRMCMDATKYLKNALAMNLGERYQFPCQLALARASLLSGNRKGALEKLYKLETSYTVVSDTEKHWCAFYQLLYHLSSEESLDSDQAKTYLEKAVKLARDPETRASVRIELANILKHMKKTDDALDEYERAFADFRTAGCNPVFELFTETADCCKLLDRMDDAHDMLGRCERILSLTPLQTFRLHSIKAEYFREAKMEKQTVEAQRTAFRNAQTDEDKIISGLQYLKDLSQRKKYKEIIAELPSLESLPKHPQTEREFRKLGGYAYFERGNWQECVGYLNPLFGEDKSVAGKDVQAAFALAQSLENLAKFRESVSLYNAIIRIAPDARESALSMKALKRMKKHLEKQTVDVESRETPAQKDVIDEVKEIIQEKTGEFTLASRLRKGLAKTREAFTHQMVTMLTGTDTIDEDLLDNLEELMILSDFGTSMATDVLDDIRTDVKAGAIKTPRDIQPKLVERLKEFLTSYSMDLASAPSNPTIYLIVGVNGVGKTTTIAKLAHRFKQQGKQVMLVAADTFRAGAIEQLTIWADRVGTEIVKHSAGADPSAVIYDAIHAARARNIDLILIDTAGRLQTKVNLMEEMKKNKRIIAREIPDAPHEILLVLDATTGQNAISQAKSFHEAVDISGIILTKLDGTAKGGIVVNIVKDLGIPVKLVGVGETMEDLQDFMPDQFIDSLFK